MDRGDMRSKYNSQKVTIDGIVFDSKRESERYSELRLLEKAGDIEELILQPLFELQPDFKYKGQTIRKVTYRADFQYREKSTGLTVVEDVKGMETKEFKLKKKFFLRIYGSRYDFRIIK